MQNNGERSDELRGLLSQYRKLAVKGRAKKYGGTILNAVLYLGPPIGTALLHSVGSFFPVGIGNFAAYHVSGFHSCVDNMTKSGENDMKRAKEGIEHYQRELMSFKKE